MSSRLAHLLEVIASPCQLTVTAPTQLPPLLAALLIWAGTTLAQLTVRLVGQVRLGGLVSWTGMVRAPVPQLPPKPVARLVLVMINRLAQLLEVIESLCELTVTAPPQLSLVVTLLVSGA